MDALLEKLASHRRRIRISRTLETSVRWAFYASVLACVYLTAQKIAGLTVPRSIAVTALVAIPLGMAAREWARAFSVRDCAIHLDRVLGLEERLSTAVEMAGVMDGAQAVDAALALDRARLPSRRAPREAKLLCVSGFIAAALLVIPAPEHSGAPEDPALLEVSAEIAAKLDELGKTDADFLAAAELLRQGQRVEALLMMLRIEEKLGDRVLETNGADAQARKLLDAAASAAAALGAELARAGHTIHAPPPALVEKKLALQASTPAVAESRAAAPVSADPVVRSALARRDWNPRYHDAVVKYFGSER